MNDSPALTDTVRQVPRGTNLVEWYFEQGWTDGLPVVPPTPSAVEAMVDALGGEPDLATLARGQGAEGFGPIRRPDELLRALRAGIDCVEGGGVAVVDVRVEPGYAPVNAPADRR